MRLDDYLSIREVAEIIGVSQQSIRNYIKAGMLPGALKFRDTRWIIPKTTVRQLLDGKISMKLKKPTTDNLFALDEEGEKVLMNHVTIVIDCEGNKIAAKSMCDRMNEIGKKWSAERHRADCAECRGK